MINCALSSTTVEKLYKSIYKHMSDSVQEDGKPFSPVDYMAYVYGNKAQASNPETAAKLVQQIPRMIIDLYNTDFIMTPNFTKLDLNTLADTGRSYLDSEEGITNVINTYKETSKKFLRALTKTKKAEKGTTEEIDEIDIVYTPSFRFMPYSSLSGTSQELIALDPTQSDVVIETLEKSKKVIYNTLSKIKAETNGVDSVIDDLVFQNKTIKFKAVPVISIDQSELDDYTRELIIRARSIKKTAQPAKGVTPADEQVLLVMSDTDGNFIYFSEDGDISTKEDGGKLVYQFLRDSKKDGNNYSVSNIYGYKTILSPEEISKSLFKTDDPGTVDYIKEEQQAEFKMLYDLKERVLKNNEQPLLPISGISTGIFEKYVGKTVKLNDLAKQSTIDKAVFKSIKTVQKDRGSFKKGFATITLNGTELIIDRPDTPAEVARQVADVITNKNLAYKVRIDFYNQFFNNAIDHRARRHVTSTDINKQVFIFNYSNSTFQQNKTRKFLENSIDLSQNAIEQLSDEDLKVNADKVFNVLMTAKGKDDKIYPTKLSFSSNLLNNERYLVYDSSTKELGFGNYIEFIKTLPATITLGNVDKDVVNTYVHFGVPSKLNRFIDSAKESVAKDNRTTTKKIKDDLVNLVKENGVLVTTVNSTKSGIYMGKNYANFQVDVPGSDITAKAYFPNKSLIVTKNNQNFKDESFPTEGESVLLKVRDELAVDGKVYKDVVEVYKINEDGSTGQYIGSIAERDVSEYQDAVVPEEVEEITPEETIEVPQKIEPIVDDIVNNVTDIEPDNANTNVGNLLKKNWKGLNRAFPFDTKVTEAEIDAANTWWKNSPLKKHIRLEHAANLVNSDVFANFVVSGATLLDWTRKGKISIYEKGSMVDVYHEAFHGFTQLYLTREQKLSLYDGVRNYKNDKGQMPYANKSFFEIEEMMAEDFRTYAKNPKTFVEKVPIQKSLFRKMLDFLYTLFTGRKRANFKELEREVIIGNYPLAVDQMFKALYFADRNPKFLNTYKPSAKHNPMFDLLNRGVERVDDRNDDALSRQDSILVTETIDSILSEMIDDLNSGFNVKASTIKLLTDPENKAIAYETVKETLEEKLKEFKDKLGNINTKSFDEFSSIEDLSANAAAVITSTKGDNKYIFFTNQVDSFANLTPDTKGGERIKGQNYNGIDIIADFFSHKNIISEDGEGTDIIIVKDLRDAQIQFDNYKKGGAKSFDELIIKQGPKFKPLTYEDEQILDNIRILQTTVDNWGDEKKGVIKYHKENSRFDIIKEDYSEVEYNEVDENGDIVDETSIEGSAEQLVKDGSVGKKSLEQIAQKETLYIVKSLFKVINNKTVDNKLGFKQLADFSKMWKIITREIGGVKNVEEMYKKLQDAANVYAPELKQLVNNKLPNPNNIQRAPEFDIISSFWQTFSRPRVPYMQLTAWMNEGYDPFTGQKTIDSITTEVIDASIDASNIIRNFQAEFRAQSEKDNKYISKVDNVTTLNNLKKIVDDFADPRNPLELNIKKSFQFARAIGFMFDDLDVIKKRLVDDSQFYSLPYIYSIVRDFANIQSKDAKGTTEALKILGDFVINPLQVLQRRLPGSMFPSLKSKEVYQKNIVKRLAELQGRYGLTGSNFSVMNPEKNLVNEFIDDHSISRMVDAINRAESLEQLYSNPNDAESEFKYMSYLDPSKNSFVSNNRSQILNSIFFTEGDGKKIKGRALKLFIDAGTQIANTDIGTVTTSLDIYSKFLQEMHLMLKGGVQEFIRHASKKSSFGAKVEGGLIEYPGKGVDKNLYVDVNMFLPNAGGREYAVNNILIPYLGAEFERILKFKNNKEEFKKYIGYNRVVGKDADGNDLYSGEVLAAFDNILTEETKEILMSQKVLDEVNDLDISLEQYLKKDKSALKQMITNDIINYFTEQTADNISLLGVQEYIDDTLYEKFGTTTISKDEQKTLLVEAYTYNSWIHNFETINLFYGDLSQFNHAKEEMHKRNTGSTSGGPKFMTDTIAQDFVNNIWNADRLDAEGNVVERVTYASKLAARKKNSEYNKFKYDGTFNTAVIKDVERASVYLKDIEKALRSEYKRAGKSEAQIEELIKKELKPYQEMTEADGAGYINIDAYRTLKKLENAWSSKQEELYKKIINNKPIKASDVTNFFPVYKLQHFGPLADTIAPVTAMHKFALMPLIPSEIGSSQLDQLQNEMLRNNIQYVTFKSGSKVGGVTTNGKPDNVFSDESMTKLKDVVSFTPNRIYLEYLKNVTNVNTKYKTEITFPTQLRGLILDGMYSKGIVTKAEYEKLGDNYDKIVEQYTDLLKLEVLNEIGYEEKDGKYLGNIKNFLEMVQKELGKRDMPDHLLRSIGVDHKGNMKTDLSLHLEADTIERMLLSVLTKRLIRQKVKGEALIQVPSTMYNGLWDNTVKFDKANDDDVKKYLGSNNLPSYYPGKDGTNAMKIAIALQGDFVNLLQLEYNGKEIGDISTLNEAIKDEKWLESNRKSITLVGARIPIQNLNSMEFAEVWHFLDASAGNKVVVPTEIVAKAGSDYDVDKIFWMMPHINGRGEHVTGAISNTELKQKIKDLENFKPKPGMKKPNPKMLIQKQKKALENELIQATRDILATPGNFASLIKPNDTHLVKGTADELAQYVIDYDRYKNMHGESLRMGIPDDAGKQKKAISPTRVLEVGYNLHKHDVNMVGKDTLGIEALQNKKHPIFKSIGAKMPLTYKAQYYDETSAKYVDDNRDYDMRLMLPHNTIEGKDGKQHISLSNDTNVSGTRIADIYSHIMNGLLDVEADPWAFFIQANLETISILNYLLETGVPEKTAILFVSQPMIREYTGNQKILNSTFATLANKEKIPFQFIKYKAAELVNRKIPYKTKAEWLARMNSDNLDRVMSELKDSSEITVESAKLPNNKQTTTLKNLKEAIKNNVITANDIIAIKEGEGIGKSALYKKAKSLITNDTFYDASTIATSQPGVLNSKGEFDEDILLDIIKNPKDPNTKGIQIATFLHFLEIEKQIKGLESVKRQSNPDTKLLKTVQQIRKREQAFIDSTESSKIDPELPEAIRSKSILKSFYQGDLALDLIEPVLPLRLNTQISNFITETFNTSRSAINFKFGQGMEGEERFTSEFNNAVINYIFQNYMSNFIDDNGNALELPTTYRQMDVVVKPNLKYGVNIDGNTIQVDSKKLKSDYTEGKFLRNSNAADSYKNMGLATFKTTDNPFPTQASYNRFVIEREYLRNIYSQGDVEQAGYEKFLTQRALINTFNRDTIVGTDEFSYSDLVMKTIREFSHLKEQYPVLSQISILPFKGKEKIIQLNDQKLLTAELGDVYYQNLKELADVNIRKITADSNDDEAIARAAADNKRLSDVFRVFSLMMIHQHGVGYSKYGFNKALDDTKYLQVMRSASGVFLDKNLNQSTLSKIYNNLMGDGQFKNYVQEPAMFNSSRVIFHQLNDTIEVKKTIEDLVGTMGEAEFNQRMQEINPDIAVIDVPVNVDLTKLYSEEYDDYVDVTYEAVNTMLNRLAISGVDVDKLPFLFYNFETDSPMSASEFTLWLQENIKEPEVEQPEEIIEKSMGIGEQLNLFEEEKVEAKENKTSKISTIEKPIKVYSDGSDIKGTGKVGFGAVYMYQGKEFGLSGTEEGDIVKDLAAKHPGAKFSNPTMEMLALASVLETFQDTGEHISIYQDYSGAVNYNGLWQHSEGSEQRADKPWKAKELYIKDLVDRSVEAIKKIEANGGTVRITWIRGHAGDPMNEAADKYAKSRKNFNAFLKPLSNESIEPVTLKGKMSYSYGKNKREEVTADSTIQAVALGERTATTRYSDQQGFAYWKKAKKGDIIEWVSDNGDSVKVTVTKPLEKLVGSGKTAAAWSELEGWSVDYFNAVVRPKLDTAWQIEFEYIPDSYKNAINTAEEGTTSAPTDDYSVIQKFYTDITEEERATGKKLISNLGTVDNLIERYVEQFADSMSQEQFIEYIRNCG